MDPSVKNYHWLDLDPALLEAYDHDADLVVLRDLSGAVTEGPGYNVFAYVDGRWLTRKRARARRRFDAGCRGHRAGRGLHLSPCPNNFDMHIFAIAAG